MRRRGERTSRWLEGIRRIARHAEHLLRALVVRRQLGVVERPVDAESVASRRAKRVVGEAMSLTLIVQRRAAEAEHSQVMKGPTAGARAHRGVRKAERSQVGKACLQRRPVFEEKADVTGRGFRVTERPRAELPVRMIHRKIPLRFEAPAPFQKKHAHPGFDEAQGGKASAGTGADDDSVEALRSGDRHDRGRGAADGGSAYSG